MSRVARMRLNPYEPASVMVGVEVQAPRQVIWSGGDSDVVLLPDPMRIYALILFPVGTLFEIRPQGCPSGRAMAAVGNEGYLLLHSASLPGLVQGGWVGRWGVPATICTVIEVRGTPQT